ncbi:hypothetical protein DAI22_12g105700 [Oryza sativa Japonica Group]|nr:hypothetical protein DAI22_12g105700 [Oryza sativa Japonica Group]
MLCWIDERFLDLFFFFFCLGRSWGRCVLLGGIGRVLCLIAVTLLIIESSSVEKADLVSDFHPVV